MLKNLSKIDLKFVVIWDLQVEVGVKEKNAFMQRTTVFAKAKKNESFRRRGHKSARRSNYFSNFSYVLI